MIEAVKIAGKQMARCVCDDCGAMMEMAAAHAEGHGGIEGFKNRPKPKIQTISQVNVKLQARGWAIIKGKIRCPECEAKRKESKPMAENVTPIRKPTREQKREIISLLDAAYDTKAGRYKGAETDMTIADMIDKNILPGWVAEIREDLYGPAGGNDEMETIAADLLKWKADMETVAADLQRKHNEVITTLRAFNEGRGRAEEFLKRIEAVKAAVGPKASRA